MGTVADRRWRMTKEDKDDHGHGHGGGNSGPGDGSGNGGQGHQPDTVTIIVNGKAKQVQKNAVLSFWDVVKHAFDNPQMGDGIQYTVQFTRGEGNKPAGALVEGQNVKVKDGMEFDVTPTNRS
jgi:Multiubiquitin